MCSTWNVERASGRARAGGLIGWVRALQQQLRAAGPPSRDRVSADRAAMRVAGLAAGRTGSPANGKAQSDCKGKRCPPMPKRGGAFVATNRTRGARAETVGRARPSEETGVNLVEGATSRPSPQGAEGRPLDRRSHRVGWSGSVLCWRARRYQVRRPGLTEPPPDGAAGRQIGSQSREVHLRCCERRGERGAVR